jgi:hypothetical protein
MSRTQVVSSTSRIYQPNVAIGLFILAVLCIAWDGGWTAILTLAWRDGADRNAIRLMAGFAAVGGVFLLFGIIAYVVNMMRSRDVVCGTRPEGLPAHPVCPPSMPPEGSWICRWTPDERGGLFAPAPKADQLANIAVFGWMGLVGAVGVGGLWLTDTGPVFTPPAKVMASIGIMAICGIIGFVFSLIIATLRRSVASCRIDGEQCVLEQGGSAIVIPRSAIAAVQFCLWSRKQVSRPSSGRQSTEWVGASKSIWRGSRRR